MSENIFIQETWVNQTKGWRIGDSEVYETYHDTIGKLFTSLQKEYGRCVGNMYVDTMDGDAKKIGWVFEKKEQYTDCNEYFIRETWVTLHKRLPEKSIEYFYNYEDLE